MPRDLTLFAAQYLVFIDAVLAMGAVVYLLMRQPRTAWLRWMIAIGLTFVLAFILAQIGHSVYNDPRPFTVDHVTPLLPHAADNGFPSDHGLLAAALVAAVLLLDLRFVGIFVVLGALVDWARVGAGIHHVVDVLGSAAFVGIGLLVGYLVAPVITRWLVPRIPARFLGDSHGQRDADESSQRLRFRR